MPNNPSVKQWVPHLATGRPEDKTKPSLNEDDIQKLIQEGLLVIEEQLPQWKSVIVKDEPIHMVAILPVIRLVKRIYNEHGHTPCVAEKKEKLHIVIGITFSEESSYLSFEEEEQIYAWTTHTIIVKNAVELATQLHKLGKRYAN